MSCNPSSDAAKNRTRSMRIRATPLRRACATIRSAATFSSAAVAPTTASSTS